MNVPHNPRDIEQSQDSELRLTQPLGISLLFIYFMIGFVLSSIFTMIVLSLGRNFLPSPAEVMWVRYLVVAPLVVGVLFGGRTAQIGARERLPLLKSLRRALWF